MSKVDEHAPQNLKVGREIGGRYLLIRPLTRLALWQTWWAEDCRDGGRVVVRVLAKPCEGGILARNSLGSALETLGNLHQDGGILRARLQETDDCGLLIIQRGLQGVEPLSQRLSEGGEDVPDGEEASRILHALSRALFRLHNAGLVHGNLHGAQVLLSRKHPCILTDCVVSRFCWSQMARQGFLKQPTAHYHAHLRPVDLERKPAEGDDLYALSQMIYRWLTGTSPSPGTDYEPVAVRRASLQPRRMPITEEWSEVIDSVLSPGDPTKTPSSESFFSQLNQVSGWRDRAFFQGDTRAALPKGDGVASFPPEAPSAEIPGDGDHSASDDSLQLVSESEDGGPLEVIRAAINPALWKSSSAKTPRTSKPEAGDDKENVVLELAREHWPIILGATITLLAILLSLLF